MNSKERFLARLRGQPVDRPPNLDIFMTFAAHYIGQPLSSYYLDYRVLSEANLALLDPFQVDVVQVISDPYRETADFGAEILFPRDDLPYCPRPLISEPGDLLKLVPPDPYNGRRMSDRLLAVRYLKEQVGDETPVMGWVEGALAEAAVLRGVGNFLLDLSERPEWVDDILEMTAQVSIKFAKLQVAVGADIIGLGDAIASQISPKMYRRFALPYEQQVFNAVHEMGALARLHICGNTIHLLPDMLESGADIIDQDWMVDLNHAAQLFGERASPCGNMDPVSIMLQGTTKQVFSDTQRAIQQSGTRGLNAAGCEIPDGTPEENLRAQSEALKSYAG
ncbi:MAG: Uroporphyrinogen decarboxylase superfamily [Chloroflexi bacterium]|nr:Uroporphyrinogen decarboxylase superfamily [Chloroflexota bacterium]